MKKKTIYAVNSGSYSDFSIDALFSTREKAEEFMGLVRNDYGDYNDIIEYELDNDYVRQIKAGYCPWFVTMLKDGTVVKSEPQKISKYTVCCRTTTFFRVQSIGENMQNCLHSTVIARNSKHAIKIVNEIRIKMIAIGEWK